MPWSKSKAKPCAGRLKTEQDEAALLYRPVATEELDLLTTLRGQTMKRYTMGHWGTYEVEVKEGNEFPEIHHFRHDPDPSAIGLHQLDPALRRLRVERPAIRRAWLERRSTERAGYDAYVEVSWDEALDIVATEISRVTGQYGNEAIFGGSYGWASAGRFHHALGQLHRFLNCAGGYVRSKDSYSLGAAHVLMKHIVAPMEKLIPSHTSWDLLAEHCTLFVSFGGIPAKNAQVNPGGVAVHNLPAGLRAMTGNGGKIINIGPVADNLAKGIEAEWIACRPNTDTALMMALAWVLIEEELLNREFLARYTIGFEWLEDYVRGRSDGISRTPAWAEAICGVPAGEISALARKMAASHTMINVAWSLQRAVHGEQPYWMAVSLAAMLGQIGTPGGGFGVGYGAANLMGSNAAHLQGPTFPQGKNKVTSFIPVARIADMLLNPGQPFTYDGETLAYPDIRLVYWAGGNPFHHHQDLHRLGRAWQKPETIIVNEQYWTATARRADIVLPATISLERDDIGAATLEPFMVAMRSVLPPQGEARDDYSIFAGLAERLGCGDAFTQGRTVMDWLRELYGNASAANAANGIDLPGFDQFWEDGLIDLRSHSASRIMLGDFCADPVANPLQTPSGRIEIYSEKLAGFGLSDCPGHPVWLEPEEWLGNLTNAPGSFHLISDQPKRRLHSQWDASPYSMGGKVRDREAVFLNPGDAASLGIGDGDLVELHNDRGRCLAGAVLSEQIMPGVVRLCTGAWFDPDENTGLEKHGNPNVLTSDRPASGLSQGCAAQTCLVWLRIWEGPAPDLSAHQPPDFAERPRPALRA
jgi:biotin/methionine sulfoxide reductase